jgi:hypothetical protein
VEKISLEELTARIDHGESFVLIETLPRYEYLSGHLPGAINIPANQIGEISASAVPDKTAEIVVYCLNPQCHASEKCCAGPGRLGHTSSCLPGGKLIAWFGAGAIEWGRSSADDRSRLIQATAAPARFRSTLATSGQQRG